MKFKVSHSGHDVEMRAVYLRFGVKGQSIDNPKIYICKPVHWSEGHIEIVKIGDWKVWGEEYIYHEEHETWYFWLDFIELERQEIFER